MHGGRWLASRRGSLARLVACGVWLAATLPAADLTGTWMGLIEGTERRPARDIAFQLVQDGDKLSGKLYRDDGPGSPILEGEISDGKVWFTIEAREQRGNQINIVLYRFDGKLADGGIEVMRERAAARDAVSGVDVPVRRPDDTDEEDRERRFQSFTLERLF